MLKNRPDAGIKGYRVSNLNRFYLPKSQKVSSNSGAVPRFARRGSGFPEMGAKLQNGGYLSLHQNTILRQKFPDRHEFFPKISNLKVLVNEKQQNFRTLPTSNATETGLLRD